MNLLQNLERSWSYRLLPTTFLAWCEAVSKWIDGGSVFADFNTLLPGNVGLPNWSFFDTTNAPLTLANAGSVYGPTGTAASAVWVNPGGVAVNLARLACPHGVPLGVSAVNLEIRAALPVGVVASKLYLELRETGGALIGSGTVTLGPGIATFTVLTNAPVAWPTEYVVSCYLNDVPLGSSANAQAIIEYIALRPTVFTSGSWESDLYRIELGPGTQQGGYDLFARGRYWARQAYTKTLFRTYAPFFYLEQFCNNTGVGNGCLVKLNGQALPTIFNSTGTSAVPVWDFPKVSLDASADTQSDVEVDAGLMNQGPGPTGSNPANVVGTFPTAIYIPSGFLWTVTERTTPRETFTLYGDSIPSGIGIPFPELAGIPQNFRSILPYEYVSETVGARSLVGDIIFDGSVANLARIITKNRPKILWVQVGTNDYGGAGGGTGPVAAWQADMVALLRACVALVPDIWIFVQSITTRAFVGANGVGDTLANYQAAAAAAVATVALPNVVFVDASLWINAPSDTSDGLHYNQFGQAIYVGKIVSTLQAAGFM